MHLSLLFLRMHVYSGRQFDAFRVYSRWSQTLTDISGIIFHRKQIVLNDTCGLTTTIYVIVWNSIREDDTNRILFLSENNLDPKMSFHQNTFCWSIFSVWSMNTKNQIIVYFLIHQKLLYLVINIKCAIYYDRRRRWFKYKKLKHAVGLINKKIKLSCYEINLILKPKKGKNLKMKKENRSLKTKNLQVKVIKFRIDTLLFGSSFRMEE